MAELADYQTIVKEVKAVQWDKDNSTYEALNTALPETFTYIRPTGTLTAIFPGSQRPQEIPAGTWIIIQESNGIPTFIVMEDVVFQDKYTDKMEMNIFSRG